VLGTVLTVALLSSGQIADAPDRLITPQGVELVNDPRVFVLFAALNGLGFSDESERKGPPLRAPVYHGIRESAREAMRKEEAKLAELRKFIDQHPGAMEAYLGAVLSHDLGSDKPLDDAPSSAKGLKEVLPLLRKLGTDPAFTKLFDDLALEQRKHSVELMARLDKAFTVASKQLGTSVRAPQRLVVVPNPLDSHGAVRTVDLPKTTFLVVGPGLESTTHAVLQASLRPIVKASVSKAWANAAKFKKAWDGVKGSKSVSQRWPDGESYAAETLARLFAFRAVSEAEGKKASTQDDDFLEAETEHGYRWARPMAQAQEGGNEPLDSAVAKILAKANP
jgi:hypothetical protein